MINFTRDEFTCGCGCGFNTVDYELAFVMDDVREHFGRLTHVNSGCRCVSHNHAEGGSTKSQHLYGRGCDFWVEGVHADKVADYLEAKYPGKYGIGRYNGRTHVDTRSGYARWDKR